MSSRMRGIVSFNEPNISNRCLELLTLLIRHGSKRLHTSLKGSLRDWLTVPVSNEKPECYDIPKSENVFVLTYEHHNSSRYSLKRTRGC